ncbi:auxilin-like clathrin-binding protein required for normal clathrin function [Fusarium falciforme]|uniref:Auxilin-like clathrin-binding protein required for normal clathrin function n=1 Tax=Fusarium falciforme TaxID=195108 RepID=A0A9W8QU75_9HYPO|nr:auxilin-like clathrin-binding protein required for normal clathrin function [Fusarium falciforme]KAJ4179220.1 auxilin-like clathrin-binding protein required for normal clathrin function [Fusarium falciforme]KAJ4247073.1 auxilin-like clathrin-binding protein required for normal clathrin function [Fusarium falciforme]
MDDLSGLDWSSKPAGGQPKPPVMNSAFATMRPTPSPLGSGTNTPLSTQGSGSVAPKPAPPKPSQDSFSNLMHFGPAKTKQNLSLAERQAQLEAEKRQKEAERRKQQEAQFGNGQFWDALGSRGASTSPALQPPAAAPKPKSDDDDLFAAFNKDTKVDNSSYYPPPPESQRSTPANAAPMNLSDPSAWKSASGATGSNGGVFGVEDDDPFGLNQMKPAPAAAPVPQNDDDDFLGDLGRPVEEVRREQEAKRPQPEPGKPIEDDDSSSSEESAPQAREQFPERQPRVNKDPFDRAVAQLVDYGFSAEDSRRALVESGSGYNAQAAVNWLLDEAHRKSKEQAQGKTSSGSSSRAGSQAPRSNDRSPARGDQDLGKAAASMGNSLFKTANSLWKTGQKKMQQAVADFQHDGDPSQPKWMREAQQARAQGPGKARADATDEALMLESGGRPPPRRTASRPAEQRASPQPTSRGQSPAHSAGSRASPAPRWQQQAQPPAAGLDSRSRLNRLAADDDSFSTYSSPNRRKKAASPAPASAPSPKPAEPESDLLFNSQEVKSSLPSRPAQPSPRPTPTPQAKRPSPPASRPSPRPAREIPSISPVSLQTSTQHRLQGTAHFKRGDYAAAHSSYSSSLSAVPPTHPLAILLLTNRALTALKTGEPKQAVDDADSALKLIGPSLGQGETVAVKNESGVDENRDMKDLYGKALSRKAEALEQMEKWKDAGAVWQVCVEGGVGGANAIKGRQRCQNALAPKPKPTPKPAAAKPRPRPSATASLGPQKSSEAVTRLREANEAAAREDDEKFVLSEKVDAKISTWRDGKRDNLRALIASLDTVLWEGSGWKKVGLHELVMANKVKINYMKAIAKTHPDKLPQDASTEVRLIAGLVFSTLNESWDKFKADNGL